MILCINICNFNNFICPVSKDQLFKIIVWRNARKWSLRWCRRCVHTCRSSCGQHILRGSIKSLETGLRRSRLIWLVVFLEHDWIMFPLILGMSSSQLTNSYFSEGFKPPTSYQWMFFYDETLMISNFSEAWIVRLALLPLANSMLWVMLANFGCSICMRLRLQRRILNHPGVISD